MNGVPIESNTPPNEYDPEKDAGGVVYHQPPVAEPQQLGTDKRGYRVLIPRFMKLSRGNVEIDKKALDRKFTYKYLLIFFLIVSIILSSVAIASCSNSSTSMANNYLLQYQYTGYEESPMTGDGIVNQGAYATFNSNANGTDLTVRIGYFGTCINANKFNESLSEWYCTRNVTTLSNILKPTPELDPFNAIHLMNEIRSNIISPVIFIISVCTAFFSILILAAANLERPNLFFVATLSTLISCFLSLVSLVWQQVAVDTTRSVLVNISNYAISAHRGPVPAGLGWASVFFQFCVALGIVILVINENQALQALSDVDSDLDKVQSQLGQDLLNGGRPRQKSQVQYPTDDGNVVMPSPY